MDKKLEDKYYAEMNVLIEHERRGREEFAHKEMDDLLCELLEELGYKKIVQLYKSTEKWYE